MPECIVSTFLALTAWLQAAVHGTFSTASFLSQVCAKLAAGTLVHLY